LRLKVLTAFTFVLGMTAFAFVLHFGFLSPPAVPRLGNRQVVTSLTLWPYWFAAFAVPFIGTSAIARRFAVFRRVQPSAGHECEMYLYHTIASSPEATARQRLRLVWRPAPWARLSSRRPPRQAAVPTARPTPERAEGRATTPVRAHRRQPASCRAMTVPSKRGLVRGPSCRPESDSEAHNHIMSPPESTAQPAFMPAHGVGRTVASSTALG